MPIFGTPISHAPISAAQTSPARVSSAPSLPTSEPATARHGLPDSRLRSKPDTDYGAWSSSCDTPRAYPPICTPFPIDCLTAVSAPEWTLCSSNVSADRRDVRFEGRRSSDQLGLPGRCRQRPGRVSAGECRGVVARELADVPWRPAGNLSDRRGDCCCLPAPVMRVVLQQALDLPGWQEPLQGAGECFGWYVDEGDVAPEGGGQRRGDLCVGDGSGTGQVYIAPSWPASVSVVAATAAMSRTSMALTLASPIGA